ncbi:NAD(P)H-hydrate dehydratase [Sphingomonas sp. HF-S3]|uniref:ADP-dependent (S)-NAD(P)H-hydrate dehydratase n=1 Tax=Sphingomonas rustica TaxID=3103142 RepID=A0ABV0BDJ8_9SPHN
MSLTAIDSPWLAAHPLPSVAGGKDKDARGRVLAIGGSAEVPGALLLTGDAALRSGAGKVALATISSIATAIGIAFPEAAVIALAEHDGEIVSPLPDSMQRRFGQIDALVVGPGMRQTDRTEAIVAALIDQCEVPILLDAGAMTAAAALLPGRREVVLTPHPGELARLLDCDKDAIEVDLAAAAHRAADRFGAIVALKSADTVIAAPGDSDCLHYRSGVAGLGTAGSGDVLAGLIGGLLARGAPPREAAAWGVWLHGEAGRRAGNLCAPIGFRAGEIAVHIPPALHAMETRGG